MPVAGDVLKELIRKEVDKNIEKLDYEVDCIVKDLRKGKGAGLNIKKTRKFIEDAAKAIVVIEKSVVVIDSIQKALEAASKAAEASRKASVLTAAGTTGAASAAIGIALEYTIDAFNKEKTSLKNVVKVVQSITRNYQEFLKRSSQIIIAALAAKALKERVTKKRKKGYRHCLNYK